MQKPVQTFGITQRAINHYKVSVAYNDTVHKAQKMFHPLPDPASTHGKIVRKVAMDTFKASKRGPIVGGRCYILCGIIIMSLFMHVNFFPIR